jgi:hypothetical protein
MLSDGSGDVYGSPTKEPASPGKIRVFTVDEKVFIEVLLVDSDIVRVGLWW